MRTILTFLCVFVLVACGKDYSFTGLNNYNGIFVSQNIGEALVHSKSGDKRENSIKKICLSLLKSTAGFKINYADSITFINDSKVYDCPYETNWKSFCKKSGSIKGNVITVKDSGQTSKYRFSYRSNRVYEVTSVKINGQSMPLDQIFPQANDRFAYSVSEGELEEINKLLKRCGLL